jgi:hypothetical protein
MTLPLPSREDSLIITHALIQLVHCACDFLNQATDISSLRESVGRLPHIGKRLKKFRQVVTLSFYITGQ